MLTRTQLYLILSILLIMIGLSACQVVLPDVAALEQQKLEANKEIVRRFYDEMWNEGKLEVADEIIAPEFVDPINGVTTGPDALKNAVTLFHSAFPDMKISYELWVDGDVVIAEITNNLGAYQGGLGPIFGVPDSAIGKEIVLHGIDFARIENGQYVEAWVVHDMLGFLSQFGMELVPVEE